jgi:PAS domain-containing protein
MQKELEVILTRQLAECLVTPIFVVNTHGSLLFYNEPAERLLGRRFEETGELSLAEWAAAFVPKDKHDHLVPAHKLPLVIALRERRPAYAELRIRGWDKVTRNIAVTGIPLIGRGNRFLGAIAIFWEVMKQ